MYELGTIGINAASSAQLKHAGGGERAFLGFSWGKTGHTWEDRGIDGEQGVLTGVDSIIGNTVGVEDAAGGETAHF